MSNFRLAIETTLFSAVPIDKALESCAECGFEEVEVGARHFNACVAPPEEAVKLRNSLSATGLRMCALFVMPVWDPSKRAGRTLGLASPQEADRVLSVEMMRRAIGTVRGLDCHRITSELAGDMDNPGGSRASFMKSIQEIAPELEESDITLIFEAHPGDFIEDSFEAVEMLKSTGSKKIRYNYCLPHTFLLRHSPKEIVDNAKDILSHLHVADSLRPEKVFFSGTYSPKVKPHMHLIPGDGDVNLREAFSSLESVNFDGYLSIQPFSCFDNPVRAAKESRSRTLQLIESVKS